jgi:hypothetical protein
MSSVTSQISISLDGFVAGPNQSLDNPIGEGGMRLVVPSETTPGGLGGRRPTRHRLTTPSEVVRNAD